MEKHVQDCIKNNICVILCGTGAILLIFAVILVFICSPIDRFPAEGEWYCNDLDVQVSFDHDGETFLVWNDQKVLCAAGIDKGSTWIYVDCQETDNPDFKLGETVFSGEIVQSEDGFLIIQSDTGVQYTFTRVG